MWAVLGRGVLRFDTSAIPDVATVTSATLYIYLRSAPAVSNVGGDVDVVNCTSFTSISASAYANPGTTVYSSRPLSSLTAVGWYSFAVASGAVSKTGYTYLGVRLSKDTDNAEPDPVDDGSARFYGTNGVGYKSYLRVIYTVPPQTLTPGLVSHSRGTYTAATSHRVNPGAIGRTPSVNLHQVRATTDALVQPATIGRSRSPLPPTLSVSSVTLLPGAVSRSKQVQTPLIIDQSMIVIQPGVLLRQAATEQVAAQSRINPGVTSRPRATFPVSSAQVDIGPKPYAVIDLGRGVSEADSAMLMTYRLRVAGDEPLDLTEARGVTATLEGAFEGRVVSVVDATQGIVGLWLDPSEVPGPGQYPLTFDVDFAGGSFVFPSNHPLWVTVWGAL